MNNTHLSSLAAILLAASLVFFSCTAEETVPSQGIDLERHEVIVTASLDEDSFTRTSLVTDSDEKPVAINWTPGDKIKVFSDGQAAEFTSINETPTRVARFRGYVSFVTGADDGAEIAYVWGLYPYREDAVYTEPETGVSRTAVITTTLPAAQTGKAGTFDDGYALTIGRSESLSIPFKTVYALMRFSVSSDGIKSVTFKGNNNEAIAGRVSIGMDDTGATPVPIVRSIVEPEKEITLRMADGSCFEKGKFYYIVMLPATFSSGFTFTVTRSDGMVGDFSINADVTLSRNKFSGVGSLDTRVSQWEAPGNKIYYTTTDGKALSLSGISPAPTRGDASRSGNTLEENIAPENNDGIGILRFTNTVTSIDPGTFQNCTTLKEIILPETLGSIGDGAFSGCSSLERVELLSETPPSTGENVFGGVGDHVICVPAGTEETYLGTQGWNDPETQITASQDESGTIDLGLPSGLLWASCNLGAAAPQDYGDYYAWGEIEPKTEDFHWLNYRFGTNVAITKYTPDDGKVLLDRLDDAAYVHLGNKWRMPSKSEILELIDGCDWTWTTLGGVIGYQGVSKVNGRTIFLPAGGYYGNSELYYGGESGAFWSSDLYVRTKSQYLTNAHYLYIYNGALNIDSAFRSAGMSIRPVKGDTHKVESISLSETSVSIPKGGTVVIEETILPEYSTLKSTTWTSSDETVARVYGFDGKILALTPGTAIITATTTDGGFTSQVTVTVTEPTYTEPEAIDLGLASGLRWGSFNLGASAPEGKGVFFAWGETEPNGSFTLDNYSYYDASTKLYSKYVTDSDKGTIDNLVTLEAMDDAAATLLGNGWRMPTKDEINELVDGCEWTITSRNGQRGIEGVSKSNGNSIFFPAAGYSNDLSSFGQAFAYWSSSVFETYTPLAYSWIFINSVTKIERSILERHLGMSIRPVKPTLNGHAYVEMGDGLKWATTNVGADNPEDYGDYIAWGEALGAKTEYSWSNYKFGASGNLSKYNETDGLSVLDPEDDAATANWGDGWRIPTDTEWSKLRNKDNFQWTWTSDYDGSGISGYTVISKVPGYEGNQIFLPASGLVDGTDLFEIGTYGGYWSASIDDLYSDQAFNLVFRENSVQRYSDYRCYGLSVRPVSE